MGRIALLRVHVSHPLGDILMVAQYFGHELVEVLGDLMHGKAQILHLGRRKA